MAASSTPDLCPHCGSHEVIPIIYGMPDEDLVLRDAQGTAKIGGVAMYDYSPSWHCTACNHEWGEAVKADEQSSGLSADEAAALRSQLEDS